tara:strand:+ start:122 stop:274 length:153 start_codon:yes stop_codon:yes gene_type:complete
MWFGLINTIPSITCLPGSPIGPIPGANEIVTENLAQNIITETLGQELITE